MSMAGRSGTRLVMLGLALAAWAGLGLRSPADAQGIDPSGLALSPSPASDLERAIAEQLSRIERLEAERDRADAEAVTLTARRAEANRRLRDRTRSLYRLSRAGVLPASGGLAALLGHLGRRARLERIVRADLAAMSDLRARANALRETSSTRGAELEAARSTLRALEARRDTLEREALASVWSSVATDSTSPPPPSELTFGSSGQGIRVVGERPPSARSFESERGALLIPVLAPTSMREATREQGVGLELGAALGAPVLAAAEGRVVFARSHASYGRLVIVDHGESYFTVYGGLGRIDVTVGQAVARGAGLGTADAAPVFFQIRRGTRALEARGWLGL